MANLETLTLEINADASGASGGITSLIGSINSLGGAVRSNIAPLKELASTLKEIRAASTGGNIWKNLTPHGTAAELKKATAATKEMTKAWAETHKIMPEKAQAPSSGSGKLNRYNPMTGQFEPYTVQTAPVSTGVKAADALGYDGQIKNMAKAMNNAQPIVDDYTRAVNQNVQAVESVMEANKNTVETVKNVTEATETATNSTKEMTSAMQEVRVTERPVRRVGQAMSGLLGQIGRIAKTMAIRTVLRGLMKAAKEGLNNFYQYSKQIGSGFAASLDKMSSKAGTAKNQIGAAIGTGLAAIIPIINAIAGAAIFAANALTALFALLGGGGTWSKATNSAEAFGDAVGGGGGGIKEMLADFDELNVIASQGGGGGGGGGGLNLYEEQSFPPWLLALKPFLDAVIAGTLGAVILPKILNGVKSIIDALKGGKSIFQIINDLFDKTKKTKFPSMPNYDNKFPKMPDYKEFPSMPEYGEFPKMPIYTGFPEAPDYSKVAQDALTIGGGFTAAAAGANALVTALGKIKAVLDGSSLLKQLLGGALGFLTSKLLDGNVKINVDRKEYDNFKKEHNAWVKTWSDKPMTLHVKLELSDYNSKKGSVESWMKSQWTKKIKVDVDPQSFNNVKKQIQTWLDSSQSKRISVEVNNIKLNNVIKDLENWSKKQITKNINIKVLMGDYNLAKGEVKAWIADRTKKVIEIIAQSDAFDKVKKTVVAWVSSKLTKTIKIDLDPRAFDTKQSTINTWVNKKQTKTINVEINMGSFTSAKVVVDTWIKSKTAKKISVGLELKDFSSETKALDKWAKEAVTKTIDVDVNLDAFDLVKTSVIEAWLNAPAIKTIDVVIYPATFTGSAAAIEMWVRADATKNINVDVKMDTLRDAVASINTWVNTAQTKTIDVTTNMKDVLNSDKSIANWINSKSTKKIAVTLNMSNYNANRGRIDAYVGKTPTKKININLVTGSFFTVASAIDAWANQSVTKVVNVVMKQSTQKPTATPTAVDTTQTGLGWSAKEGLTWNGQNVFDLAINGIKSLFGYAEGGYGIPKGELFVAQEAGAELVGSINGKTSVANQGQIIEGIERGVKDANTEQNSLLREQNELLRGILRKESSVNIGASAGFGRVIKQSLNMYGNVGG